jgi:NADH-quinone oxidoreductase subunit N
VSDMSYFEVLRLAAPEAILVVTLLALLGADFAGMRGLQQQSRLALCALVVVVGCVLSSAFLLGLAPSGEVMRGMLVSDSLTRLLKIAILFLTAVTAMLSVDRGFTEDTAEYFAMLLLATLGMLFLVSSEDILMIFISLELTSLSLYVLVAFNKASSSSAEAALKYFLFGGVAAAFTLFGLSLVYGITGSTNLDDIASHLCGNGTGTPALDPLLVLALVLTVVGFGFKVAAVPFHLWAPDVYQGAPGPVAAFIASGSKVASFFILAKLLLVGFKGIEGTPTLLGGVAGWMPLLALIAAASLILGNLAAIVQTSVRRLLAYSAIAHAGYVLVGFMSTGAESLAAIVYYAITYAITALGAFGVVLAVQAEVGNDRLQDFAGLSRRSPLLSGCLVVFVLSLAGIPPLAGFFGKFYVFASALSIDRGSLSALWLVLLALAMSAVSLYYYLQVLKQAYVVPPLPGANPIKVSLPTGFAILILAGATVLLGCAPQLLIGPLLQAIRLAGF